MPLSSTIKPFIHTVRARYAFACLLALTLLAAGQITGTEGYAAAVAGGWLAGTNAARLAKGEAPINLPATSMMGALTHFIAEAPSSKFQPMPPNFGLLPELTERIRDKRRRYGAYRDRALADLAPFCPGLVAAA